MSKFFKHLRLVTKHRHQVFKLCCKCGLFWRGLVHDLSKFSRVEFWESVKYYNGHHSPIAECRRQNGYSNAWIHHKNRNKHHIEYWYDRENEIQMNIPYKYAVECVCDKIAATKCYKGKEYKPEMVLNHWVKWGSHTQTNDNMKAFFTKVFTDLVELGEKQVLNKKYMKKTYNDIVIKGVVMEKLLDFLVQAKKNTYANGNALKVISSRLGSKDYHYEDVICGKKTSYHDTYFGGEKFIGCEVVYVEDQPIWAMNYNGYSVVENLSEEAMDNALRPALMQVGIDKSVLPVRGPSKFTNGEYTYTFEQSGTMENFTGLERIYKNDILIYELHCAGGIIK